MFEDVGQGAPRQAYWLPGMYDRQSAEKPLHDAMADQAIFDERPTRQTSVAQGLF